MSKYYVIKKINEQCKKCEHYTNFCDGNYSEKYTHCEIRFLNGIFIRELSEPKKEGEKWNKKKKHEKRKTQNTTKSTRTMRKSSKLDLGLL